MLEVFTYTNLYIHGTLTTNNLEVMGFSRHNAVNSETAYENMMIVYSCVIYFILENINMTQYVYVQVIRLTQTYCLHYDISNSRWRHFEYQCVLRVLTADGTTVNISM
jgi:hypothetical protein